MISIALLHHPVYNKKGDTVVTSITGMDLHDIARSALTYGISKYYVVNPAKAQLEFAGRIINCWKSEESFVHNWTRAEALALIELKEDLEQVLAECPGAKVIVTSAKKTDNSVGFQTLRKKIKESSDDFLIVFGTGWGLSDEVIKKADYILEPVNGPGEYNHLSVRSAAAIILDRLFGGR
ncbi:hypothetical protein A2276_01415 [candidate division WOR-1 bacterium RIFOXYA12_FULL_43_27]|uniref:tRNA (guanine-N(1)-)-methyltransferase C-terminal domain-containing protein n=1 Tax=candidate division WOR-1 bacterium RIFOXYC2_FULL_46_14 TaxID=1802587 RepID=A0A1F4U530_UNCSA|nr:MAG: hypothetical protein A2276_01415 [candidate division WOR-1 bacterium RIFOXYA12_FULL_43_27]OGC20657.1 MAG: hypothetical protein A2292_06460 [candidate division WOR-1 bacterium RIFOXYB2_FULL_46_45]OGC31606.1 MAG: hypothetical protein A2232_04990 [candidate division WOR-1 bacterium RIFOXYA2_FULL_46_56]OGC40011.1 MAG: hypothetical protein A2438_05835 [candidate division WOR-1 bacterium RIFOXYC2_FULL_46_14]